MEVSLAPLVEAYTPRQVVEEVKRIVTSAGIEGGGVEYLINERDHRPGLSS